jgi:Ulp1 family protease
VTVGSSYVLEEGMKTDILKGHLYAHLHCNYSQQSNYDNCGVCGWMEKENGLNYEIPFTPQKGKSFALR